MITWDRGIWVFLCPESQQIWQQKVRWHSRDMAGLSLEAAGVGWGRFNYLISHSSKKSFCVGKLAWGYCLCSHAALDCVCGGATLKLQIGFPKTLLRVTDGRNCDWRLVWWTRNSLFGQSEDSYSWKHRLYKFISRVVSNSGRRRHTHTPWNFLYPKDTLLPQT